MKIISARIFVLSLLFSLAGFIHADDLAPESPDMILPPMSLELEDLLQEDVETILPEQRYSPEFSFGTLPSAVPEIEVPDSLAELDLELDLSGADQGLVKNKTSSFYSNGKIGLGNTNSIVGDLLIYKLGAEPHFQLQFTHERLDGYHFRESGSGFSDYLNLIQGGISFRPGAYQFDFNAHLRENTNGLQGLGIYNSVLHRYIGGDTSFTYYVSDRFSIGAAVDVLWAQETLSGDEPVNGYELSLDPEIEGRVTFGPVTLTVGGAYNFRFISVTEGALHGVEGNLGLDVALPGQWNFGGSAGIGWHNYKTVQVPFHLYFEKGIEEILTIHVSGGFDTSLSRYGDLWLEATPFYRLNSETAYPEIQRWFADSVLSWTIVPNLTLENVTEFSRYEESVYPDAEIEQDSGMLTFHSGDAFFLRNDASLKWETLDWLSMAVSWKGNFLDTVSLLPDHVFGFYTELSNREGTWRGGLDVALPINNGPEMPILGCSLTFAPAGGVEFSLSGTDLLSPAMESNRTEWGYYETPGLNVMFITRISL